MIPQNCTVAIVGAGLSGLTAAYGLRDLDPIVLDADEAIGGRSQRSELADWPVSLGGAGWYDPNPESPESRLLAELGIKTSLMPGKAMLHTAAGRSVTLSNAGQLATDLGFSDQARPDFLRTFQRVIEACETLANPGVEDLIRRLLEITGAEWIGPVHDEVREYYRRLASTEIGVSLEADSAFSMLTGMPIFGGASAAWGEFLVPEGGAPMIGRAMAERLRTPPVTEALVTAVESDGSRIRLTYHHEGQRKTLHADHVVMATPHPITAQVVRGLPSAKLAAMKSMRVLPIVEVIVLLDDGGPVAWDEFSATWTVDKSFSVCVHSRIDTRNSVDFAGADKHSLIKMMAVGPSAAPLADRTDECVVRTFVDDFVDMYPAARDKIRAQSIKRWTHGVPLPAIGFHEHVAEMVSPFNGVHFAGDWCGFVNPRNPGGVGLDGDWGGYVVTAALNAVMRAGLRTAAEIRERTS